MNMRIRIDSHDDIYISKCRNVNIIPLQQFPTIRTGQENCILLLKLSSARTLAPFSINNKHTKAELDHIGHVGKMSDSGYSDRRPKPRLHQYIVSLSKTLNPHCFGRLSCEMSTRWGYHRDECMSSTVSFPEEIELKNQNNSISIYYQL